MAEAAQAQALTGFTALYPVVAVDRPAVTAAEFRRLVPLAPVFETDWYVHLKGEDPPLQIGFVRFDHESVPAAHQYCARGTFVTVDADDVAALWARVKADFDIVLPLTDEAWGQRHFITRLAGDLLVDIVQLLPRQ